MNAFQHCVAPKPFVNQANFKTCAWITGKKLKSQVNQSNLKNLMSYQSLPELPAINQTRNSEMS